MNKFVQFLQNYKIFCTLSLTISNEPQNISLKVSHKPFLSGNSWCQVRLQSLITTTSLRISHYCCDGNCSKYVILHLCKRSTTASAEQWLCIGFTYTLLSACAEKSEFRVAIQISSFTGQNQKPSYTLIKHTCVTAVPRISFIICS